MKWMEKYSYQVKEFLSVCNKLAKDFYVTSSGGNLAWKLEDDLLLITPTRMNKGDIGLEDLVIINMKGEVVEGQRRPTGETPLYIKFFNKREDITSVIHCHPPYVCALAISEESNRLMRPYFPETIIEVGPVPVVPYAEPLTEKLADNFDPYIPKYNSFVMENHGLITMTRSGIYETLMQVQLLEMSAKSILLALQAGEVKEIPRQDVRDLSNTMKTRELPLFGAPGVNDSLEDLYF